MKRLEIIHLRSSGEPLDTLGRRISDSIKAEDMGAGVVTLYRRDGLETDVAIHIHHRSSSPGEGPSSLGLRLASALKALGLVEHTMWEELS
jgi:hypothetical protein